MCTVLLSTYVGLNITRGRVVARKQMERQLMNDIVGTVVIAVPVANEITNQGIITAFELEHAVMFGMTYGAWFKIGMGVALVLLIVERGLSVRNKLYRTRETDK